MAKKKISNNPDMDGTHGLYTVPEMPRRVLQEGVIDRRASLIRTTEKKWVNGTNLHYCFLDSPSIWRGAENQKDAVRNAFSEWKQLDIGLEFTEVTEKNKTDNGNKK
eukprot:TRINITY_DN53259_c0_g1_i1.p1 TRINITY_DN53259_c0_g1~~TRINITY_DN53259_c0_g1_i1.p1  ORF type:complete len:107 (-),score=13.14 TRINITY_DN53259_c0_g1_i1:34-354(-)